MEITSLKVRKLFNEGSMKAVVSITFDESLTVHDIKVIYSGERFFVVMPSRKNPDGSFRDVVHPINSEFRALIENAVLTAYNKAIDEAVAAAEAAAEAPAEATEEAAN